MIATPETTSKTCVRVQAVRARDDIAPTILFRWADGRELGYSTHFLREWQFWPKGPDWESATIKDAFADLIDQGGKVDGAQYVRIKIGDFIVHLLTDEAEASKENNGLLRAMREARGFEVIEGGLASRATRTPGVTYILAIGLTSLGDD